MEKLQRTQILLEREQHRSLYEIAQAEGRSMSELVREAVAQVNSVLRGWVNYFRVGNSSRAFDRVKFHQPVVLNNGWVAL